MDKPKIVSLKDSSPESVPTVDVPPLPSEKPTAPQELTPEEGGPEHPAAEALQPISLSEEPKPTPLQAPPERIELPPQKPQNEEREDDLAHELTQPKIVSVQPTLVREYQEQAARDILPPKAEPAPLSILEEREKAKALAREIHARVSHEGFFTKVKRFFRLD